jgi:mono/diheme cytochrome c family protein
MPFPPFSSPILGTGMTIGLNAIIHVLLSHGIAIGVVGLIVLIDWYARRKGLEGWDRFSRRLIRFSAIMITTAGTITGVGIWFITSVLAPRGIGLMLRIFYGPWLLEWGVFVGELVVVLVLYYQWDHLRESNKRLFTLLGFGYIVLSVMTAVIITGILAFMMTNGSWSSEGRFVDAFFNATYMPQLLLRLSGAFGLGGLISLIYLYTTEADSPFRRTMSRIYGRVMLGAIVGAVLCSVWYFSMVPPNFKVHAISAVMPNAFPKDPRVFWAVNLLALSVLLLFALSALRNARRMARMLAIPALLLAIGFVSEFEYIREFIRGPYLQPGFMYANQVLAQERPYLTEQGMLKTSYWYQARPQPAGEFLFQANCGSCHTLNGTNSIINAARGRSEDGIYVIIGHTHEMVPWMPPFSGTDQERRIMANYLYTLTNGLPVAGTLGHSVEASTAPTGPADLLLPKPFPTGWMHGLRFAGFSLHLLFVLFTLGTALLGVYYFLWCRWFGRQDEPAWHYEILHRFTAYKSLAIVLGIAPLLLIQIGAAVSFFTALNLLGWYWLLIIVLLILASLAFDIIGQYPRLDGMATLALGQLGVTLLLAIPGIFIAVLILAENAPSWLTVQETGRLPVALSVHWLFRYLHILGASIVFAAALHWYRTSRENVLLRESLRRFVLGGLLVQIVLGVMLFLSVMRRTDQLAYLVLSLAVAAALTLTGMLIARRSLPVRMAPALLTVIFIGMLLTRQVLQLRTMAPVEREAERRAEQYQQNLVPYRQAALAAFQHDQQTVYDDATTIYAGSCAFCHGSDGRGNGSAASDLAIPPRDLTAIRTTRPYLTRRLTEGIPGTGMPFFSIYTTDKLDRLVDELDKRYQMLDVPDPVTYPLSPAARQQAAAHFQKVCATCHGQDGRGQTQAAGNLSPAPPDLTQFTMQPDSAYTIITDGYPGTAMAGSPSLSVDTRWALVEKVQGFYRHREGAR